MQGKCKGTIFGIHRLRGYSNHLTVYKLFHSNTVKVLRVNHFDSHFCLAQRNNQHFKMSPWLFYHCLNNAYGADGMPAYVPLAFYYQTFQNQYMYTYHIVYIQDASLTPISIFNMLNMLNIQPCFSKNHLQLTYSYRWVHI